MVERYLKGMTVILANRLLPFLQNQLIVWIRHRWHPAYRILAVATVAGILAAITISLPNKAPDFTVFWAAATHAFGPIYDSSYLTPLQHGPPGDRPFAYPPTFLVLIMPLALVPLKTAY